MASISNQGQVLLLEDGNYNEFVKLVKNDEKLKRYEDLFDLHRAFLRLDELREQVGIKPLYPTLPKIPLN